MSIQAEALSFSYTRAQKVLADVSLTAPAGKTMFILGANGSGKTTLLSCLAGVLRPESGRIAVDTIPLSHLSPPARARTIGFVPQIHTPVFAYTVGEVVLMGRAPHLSLLSRPGKRDREAAMQAITAVGLTKLRDHPYTEISGGERRLTLIARGLAQGVKYLLLDEPDAHLDPAYQHHTLTTLAQLAHTQGLGILISSHRPNNALFYGDSVIIIGQGKIICHGPPHTAITPTALQVAYGMEFELLTDGNGRRAVIPVTQSAHGNRIP